MTLGYSGVTHDFNNAMVLAGMKVRFRYFTRAASSGNVFDDDITMTQSGPDYWFSGIVQPILGPKGNDEAALWEQGRIIFGDNKLYVPGYVNTSGLWKVGIGGSPPAQEFGITEAGQNAWNIAGSVIYKKLYIRYLPTGSLAEE